MTPVQPAPGPIDPATPPRPPDAATPKDGFAVGDRVLWQGQGLGTVQEIEDGKYRISMNGGLTIVVPVAKASTAMHALPTVEEATALRDRLLQPAATDPRDWEARYVDFELTLSDGTLEELAGLSARTYARGKPESFGESRLLMTLEDNVVAVVAEVLGEDRERLVAEISAVQSAAKLEPKVPVNRHEPPPLPPATIDKSSPRIWGASYLGTFQAAGALVVADPGYLPAGGDAESGSSVVIDAPPGSWHTYAGPTRGDVLTRLIAVRANAKLSPRKLRKRAVEVGSIGVDGGTAAIVRSEDRDNPDILKHFGLMVPVPSALAYGACSTSGAGDGRYPVKTASDDAGIAYVEVTFD